MKRPTKIEIILGLLLVVNILISTWLYLTVSRQEDRIKTLERNDAIQQKVDSLNNKYDSLKNRVKDIIP